MNIKDAAKQAARDVIAARDAMRSGRVNSVTLQPGDGYGGYGMRVSGVSNGSRPAHRYVWRGGRMVCVVRHECENSEGK